MWELQTPGKNHWKKFLNNIIDRYWRPKMIQRLESMKIHRFIGQGDLELKKTPEIMKHAATDREIKGLEVTLQLLCGEYPIGENLFRTKCKPSNSCEICEHE